MYTFIQTVPNYTHKKKKNYRNNKLNLVDEDFKKIIMQN